jgi:hypothetical protein
MLDFVLSTSFAYVKITSTSDLVKLVGWGSVTPGVYGKKEPDPLILLLGAGWR